MKIIKPQSDEAVLHIALGQTSTEQGKLFVEYTNALSQLCRVICIVDSGVVASKLQSAPNVIINQLECDSIFDSLKTMRSIANLAEQHQAKYIITHSNDGLLHALWSKIRYNLPIISVKHNYKKSVFGLYKNLCSNAIIEFGTKPLDNFSKNKSLIANYAISVPAVMPDFKPWRNSNILDHTNLGDPINLGLIGEITNDNGAMVLIRALGILRHKKKIDICLIVEGEGRAIKNMQKLAKLHGVDDAIQFFGNHFADKQSLFKKIHILCAPQLRNGWNIAILDGMAYNTPIVANRTRINNNIIQHKHNGYLTESASHRDFAQLIEYVVKNMDEASQCAERAYVYCKNNFSIHRLAKTIRTTLDQVNR